MPRVVLSRSGRTQQTTWRANNSYTRVCWQRHRRVSFALQNFLHLSIIFDCRCFCVRLPCAISIPPYNLQSIQITNKTFSAAKRIYKLKEKQIELKTYIKLLRVTGTRGEFKLNRVACRNFDEVSKNVSVVNLCIIHNLEGGWAPQRLLLIKNCHKSQKFNPLPTDCVPEWEMAISIFV